MTHKGTLFGVGYFIGEPRTNKKRATVNSGLLRFTSAVGGVEGDQVRLKLIYRHALGPKDPSKGFDASSSLARNYNSSSIGSMTPPPPPNFRVHPPYMGLFSSMG